MLWIGLTGSIGSGKSTVARLIRSRGFPVLDADEIVHLLLAPGGPVEREIFTTFGEAVRGGDGRLDRRALGRLVFSDRKKLDLLEGILHPKVRAEVARQKSDLAAKGYAAAFYDVPLLFEKKMQKDFDLIVVVSADEKLRRERIHKRMGLSDAEISERMASQISPADKEKAASVIIRNDGSEEDLRFAVDKALKKIQLLSPAVADSQ